MHSLGYAHGLYPAQWTALRYFARETQGVPTASGLARFQGLAIGPVSRTVRTLVQKGLIRKKDGQPAGRAEYLELTSEGIAMLEQDPMQPLNAVIELLSPEEQQVLANVLEKLIKAAAHYRALHARTQSDDISRGAA